MKKYLQSVTIKLISENASYTYKQSATFVIRNPVSRIPVVRNLWWSGRFWPEYSSVFPAEIVITVYYDYHHHLFMQSIYTYIPETNYVPWEYGVAAILLLPFTVLISLLSVLNLLFFYTSTFRSMCAVPNMAVFCSSLTSCFPGLLLLLLLLLLN